jgi:hypothetical protein
MCKFHQSQQSGHWVLVTDDAERVTESERGCRSTRGYALRGLVRCGICGRKMQGSWNNGKPHYRCVFLSQYAAKN